jgi:fanconi-associated nuclease 1
MVPCFQAIEPVNMDAFVHRSTKQMSRTPLADVSNSNRGSVAERPPKRLKVEDSAESHDDASDASDEDSQSVRHDLIQLRTETSLPEDDAEPDRSASPEPKHETAFESSLPPVSTDREAIEEYEAMRASQKEADEEDSAASRIDSRKWVRGKSSIYVDAFNLALDTVMEDEADLFDDKEKAVFEAWRNLGYEAQYLYVRLFLRKTSAWHRSDRLGYYSDISDPDAAIATLQCLRALPPDGDEASCASLGDELTGEVAGIPLQDWSLGGKFTFADCSDDCITTVEEAAELLSLDELKSLAKEAKVTGRNKVALRTAFVQMSGRQKSLGFQSLRRSSTEGSIDSQGEAADSGSETPETTNQKDRFLKKIMAITGPCIRISPSVFKLFERVHLVFYRSTEWTEKSLTTIILAKISRRNFPEYIVCRSSNIFATRRHLLEFEQAMRMEYEVDQLLEHGPLTEHSMSRILDIFAAISPHWRSLLAREQHREDHEFEFNEGVYLRRFNAAHAYTRVAHKAAYVHGRQHDYRQEHELLSELLAQRLFQMARRGAWYQRKALLEQHYMAELDAESGVDLELRKKQWRRKALQTCEEALQDRDCHLIYHYDLQKRLVKLERVLRIPRRLQHEFAHVKLAKPEEHTVSGIQLKRESEFGKAGKPGGPSTKTAWVDEAEGGGECSVEAMCLSHYRSQGWKGYHAEGGIVRTLFAYLFFDILFLYIPNVFQTAFQTCPLDLHTDAFFPARASEINHRLAEIANGGAEAIVRRVHAEHHERRTCVVGLNWDFGADDLAELAGCFRGEALAAVCKVMAQEYRQRGGGVPDLLVWRVREDGEREAMFVEVKSANDRLSDTQRLWIHVLTGAGVRVALCAAVAKEVRMVD